VGGGKQRCKTRASRRGKVPDGEGNTANEKRGHGCGGEVTTYHGLRPREEVGFITIIDVRSAPNPEEEQTTSHSSHSGRGKREPSRKKKTKKELEDRPWGKNCLAASHREGERVEALQVLTLGLGLDKVGGGGVPYLLGHHQPDGGEE